MRHRSKKTQARYREYRKTVAKMLGPQARCAAAEAPEPCFGPLTPHHIKTRARGGSHELDNLVPLCTHHQTWVEGAGAEWAYEHGLLRHSWE